MELEDPTSLDKAMGFFDSEYGENVYWYGVLRVEEDIIVLDDERSDATRAEYERQIRLAQEALAAEEALRPERVDHDAKVRAAREQDLLPPGA
jgi:hypothetical protein